MASGGIISARADMVFSIAFSSVSLNVRVSIFEKSNQNKSNAENGYRNINHVRNTINKSIYSRHDDIYNNSRTC